MAQYSFNPPPVPAPAVVVTDYAMVKEVLGRKEVFESPFERRVRKLLQAVNGVEIGGGNGNGWGVVPRVVSFRLFLS